MFDNALILKFNSSNLLNFTFSNTCISDNPEQENLIFLVH